MTFFEKITDPTAPMHWRGDMQADYRYTHGAAGDRFFRHIKENDSLLATQCPCCERMYMPPRMFCEYCFDEIGEDGWSEVPAEGVVRLYTVARLDITGKKLEEPRVMALIDILNTHGSLLGVVDALPDEVYIGLAVKAIFKPKDERAGNMRDFICWQPI